MLLRLHAAGEYGELLVSASKLLENEELLTVSEGEVVSLLESVLERSNVSPQCKNYALTALMKLSVRFSGQAERIKVSFELLSSRTQGLRHSRVQSAVQREMHQRTSGRCLCASGRACHDWFWLLHVLVCVLDCVKRFVHVLGQQAGLPATKLCARHSTSMHASQSAQPP